MHGETECCDGYLAFTTLVGLEVAARRGGADNAAAYSQVWLGGECNDPESES